MVDQRLISEANGVWVRLVLVSRAWDNISMAIIAFLLSCIELRALPLIERKIDAQTPHPDNPVTQHEAIVGANTLVCTSFAQ